MKAGCDLIVMHHEGHQYLGVTQWPVTIFHLPAIQFTFNLERVQTILPTYREDILLSSLLLLLLA